MADPFVIAGRTFTSRLVLGTGKYSSHQVMKAAHDAAGTEMVTVAVRRVDLRGRGAGDLLAWIDTSRIMLLPNTAGCYTADEAVRTARLAREAGLSNWIKLEVIGDEQTLLPDNEALLERLRLDPRAVAVELDRVVVRRQRYGETAIRDGAEVEVVAFVGGGVGEARPVTS